MALLLAVVAIVVVVVWAILDSDSAGPEIGTTVQEVVDDPAEFLGEQVTVSGEVENALG